MPVDDTFTTFCRTNEEGFARILAIAREDTSSVMRTPTTGAAGGNADRASGKPTPFDQAGQPYPVHCVVCTQAGDKTPATWVNTGYFLCEGHHEFPMSVLKEQAWGQGNVT